MDRGELRDERVEQRRDVAPALAERWNLEDDALDPVVEVGAKPTRADLLFERAQRRQHQPDVGLDLLRAADAHVAAGLEEPQQLACSASGISAISSRNSVPPFATSILPIERSLAPVYAPRSCPNSSLSNSASGIAAQLIGTNGPPRRGDISWSRRAITSLPEPLSPVNVTVTSLTATARRNRSNDRITGDAITGSSTTMGRTQRFGMRPQSTTSV